MSQQSLNIEDLRIQEKYRGAYQCIKRIKQYATHSVYSHIKCMHILYPTTNFWTLASLPKYAAVQSMWCQAVALWPVRCFKQHLGTVLRAIESAPAKRLALDPHLGALV